MGEGEGEKRGEKEGEGGRKEGSREGREGGREENKEKKEKKGEGKREERRGDERRGREKEVSSLQNEMPATESGKNGRFRKQVFDNPQKSLIQATTSMNAKAIRRRVVGNGIFPRPQGWILSLTQAQGGVGRQHLNQVSKCLSPEVEKTSRYPM